MSNLIHVWSILCSNSTVDQGSNNVSLFNVLEQLNLPKEAFDKALQNPSENIIAGINCEIITLLKKDELGKPIEAEEKIEFLDPKGHILGSVINLIEVPKDSHRARAKTAINGIKITSEGEYKFRISLKEKNAKTFSEVSEIPLEVKANK